MFSVYLSGCHLHGNDGIKSLLFGFEYDNLNDIAVFIVADVDVLALRDLTDNRVIVKF